jgi:hypothetical protein
MANTHSRREEPGLDYFEPVPEYTNYTSTEPRDGPSLRRAPESPTRKRSSPPINDKQASAAGRDELKGVSKELLEEITERVTERVKREGSSKDAAAPHIAFSHSLANTHTVVEHLSKQTGSELSNKSSSNSSSPPPTHTPPSPTQSTKPTFAAAPPMEPRSPPSSPLDKPGVRFSDRRPAVSRTYSTAELSTIDQKWGRLFDSEGTPTKRLGQFLRGLANHIINDFPPRKSIVITPAKMAA